jgi:riboflavin synthase alpha subunit
MFKHLNISLTISFLKELSFDLEIIFATWEITPFYYTSYLASIEFSFNKK